jgi:hypothetical protein
MLLLDHGLPKPSLVKKTVQEIFSSRGTHQVPATIETPPITWASSYTAMARDLQLPETALDNATTRLNGYWKTIF